MNKNATGVFIMTTNSNLLDCGSCPEVRRFCRFI